MKFTIRVTERCNLRCSHCYAKDFPMKEITKEDFEKGILEIMKTPAFLFAQASYSERRLVLSGGEALLHPHFRELFLISRKYIGRHGFTSVTILSNGTYIDDDFCLFIKQEPTISVQISIDGHKNSHDKIRESGSYNDAIRGLSLLQKHEIERKISYTVGYDNSSDNDIESIIEVIKQYKCLPSNIVARIGAHDEFNFCDWILFREKIAKKEKEINYQLSNHTCHWRSSCGERISIFTMDPDTKIYGCERCQHVEKIELKDLVSLSIENFTKTKKSFSTCLEGICSPVTTI